MGEDMKKPKGFAGLEGMVTEIDLPDPPRRPLVSAAQARAGGAPESHNPFQVDESRLAKPKPRGMSAAKKWAIAAGLFVTLIVIANISDKKSNSGGGYTPPSIFEDPPPVGSGLVLSDNQIRYCVSQDIRLSAWSAAVNKYSHTAVASFNEAVGNYNNRCASYKYRSGALERVRAEVETRRAFLETEGASKAALNP